MDITYKASPTAVSFHADNESNIRGVRGPVGGGKSVLCITEILKRATGQAANKEGVRKTRFAVVRNTYGELLSTTIKTFQDWIPENVCPIKGGSPIEGLLQFPLPDGTKVRSEILFLALDKPKDVKRLMSLEVTGIFINEAQFLDLTFINGAYERCGRYPSAKDGVLVTWYGLWMDTNSPDDDHWWYKLEQEDTPEGWAFYVQPPALIDITEPLAKNALPDDVAALYEKGYWRRKKLPDGDKIYCANPTAENVINHSKKEDAQGQRIAEDGYNYWLNQVPSKEVNKIKAQICNEFSPDIDGLPIYEQHFNQHVHISEAELLPIKSLPLAIGFDFGVAAAVIGQLLPSGQLRLLDELCSEQTMGLESFCDQTLLPLLRTKYRGFKLEDISVFGDPAGQARAGTDLTCFDVLWDRGLQVEAVNSNDPKIRWDAVRHYLGQMALGGQPAMLVSPHLKQIKKGFIGDYKFRRLQVSGTTRFSDKAEKNTCSHPHDALQYLCMGLRGEIGETTLNTHNATGYQPASAISGY